MFPNSLRFFWSLQFSTGSQWGYPRVVPPGGLSELSTAVMVHLLHIYTNHTVVQQSGTFHSWGGKIMLHCLDATQEHSIIDKILSSLYWFRITVCLSIRTCIHIQHINSSIRQMNKGLLHKQGNTFLSTNNTQNQEPWKEDLEYHSSLTLNWLSL